MELVSKPDTTAAVWEHFGFKPNGRGEPLNLDEPVCRICFETVATKSSNTTNMHLMQSSQLRKKKKKKKKKKKTATKATERLSPSSQQSTITGAFSRQTKYKQDNAKWCTITDSVVRYITKEMQPFSTVKKPAFQQMLQTFDSQYKLPGRTYVSQTAIPQLYSMKENILNG